MTGAGVVGVGLSRLHVDLHLENLHADAGINVTGAQVTLARAASRYVGKVDEFLDEYSYGTRPGQRVPFGGRKAELDRLDAWLADPHAPQRFLISGPTGRGKSALLVRWRERLVATPRRATGQPAWRLVFFPISLRAGTNPPEIVYEAIAASLAEILKVDLPASEIGSVSYYQNWCRQLCDQIIEQKLRVLIVLDGLDEILGGEFDAAWFPRSPGPNLRLVVAARWVMGDEDARGWVKRLDWNHNGWVEVRDLAILDQEGVRDVLVSVGAPLEELADRREVVEKLQRLSEGEPLLLRLYAEDLWALHEAAGQLRIEDLDEIQPGFTAYFDKRLEKQKQAWKEERSRGAELDEATLYAHLAVLACAYGRLGGSDIGQLVERAHGLSPDYRLEDTLEPVRRFIYGAPHQGQDAIAEGGYVLSHPKFGEFFQGHLDAPVIDRTKAAFVSWGKDTLSALNEGKLAPEGAAPYLLQFYARHLEDVNAGTDQFRELLENGWRRAWEVREGGFQGFTNDVQIAWTAIRRELLSTDCAVSRRQQLLCAAIRCALYMSSVLSLGVNISASLLQVCLSHQIITPRQALHIAGLRDNVQARGQAFTAIAPLLDCPEQPLAVQIR